MDLIKKGNLGVFDCMEDAIEASFIAQKEFSKYTNKKKSEIINAFKEKLLSNVEEISKMAYEETGMGRFKDKILKNKLAIKKTPGIEDLKAGVITGDKGVTMFEMVPFGVIGAIAPSTNPTETIINNGISMLSAGNSVVFSPHPGAKDVSVYTVQLINKAIKEINGPENLITTVSDPSIEKTNILLSHKKVSMICVTGGPAIVKIGLSSGKKTIGAGAGNPPVLVDETADIEKASKDIINGCSFDNNLPCIAEKEIIVVDSVADELIENMRKYNGYEIKDEEILTKLKDLVVNPEGGVNKKYVGKDPDYIMKDIGVDINPDTKVIFAEVSRDHPFAVEELMMPIIPVIRVKDIDEGIILGKELEHGNRHTAIMHSKNIDNLARFEREVGTTIFVKNAPSYAGIGYEAEGFATFTIAGPTGEGLTSASTFTRKRRLVLSESLAV